MLSYHRFYAWFIELAGLIMLQLNRRDHAFCSHPINATLVLIWILTEDMYGFGI